MRTTNRLLAIIITLTSVVALAPSADAADKKADRAEQRQQAREKRNNPERPKDQQQDRAKRIADDLKITKDQQEKLKPILQAESKEIRALRQDTALSRQDRRDKLAKIREATSEKVKAILSTDQFEKWKKMREEKPEAGNRKRQN